MILQNCYRLLNARKRFWLFRLTAVFQGLHTYERIDNCFFIFRFLYLLNSILISGGFLFVIWIFTNRFCHARSSEPFFLSKDVDLYPGIGRRLLERIRDMIGPHSLRQLFVVVSVRRLWIRCFAFTLRMMLLDALFHRLQAWSKVDILDLVDGLAGDLGVLCYCAVAPRDLIVV